MSDSALHWSGGPTARRTIPPGIAYALLAVVGATGLAVSAFYLWHLALQVHMPKELAWSLPVTLDAGAAGATIVWVGGSAGRAREWARAIALCALAATLVGNALSHVIEAKLVEVTPVLVIAIGVVYPAMFAALAHLTLMLTAERSAEAAESLTEVEASVMDREPVSDASPIDQTPVPVVAESVVMDQPPVVDASPEASEPVVSRRRGRSTPERRRRWINAELDEGREVTGGQVERRFGSRNGAREVAQVIAARAAVASDGEVA